MAGRWNLFDDSGTEGSKSTWGGLHSSSRRGFNGVIPFLPNVPWFWDVLIVSSQDMCGKIGEILHKYPKLSGICFPLSIVWWCFVHRARYHPGGWRYLDGHHVLSCSQGEMHRPPKLHRFLFGGLAIPRAMDPMDPMAMFELRLEWSRLECAWFNDVQWCSMFINLCTVDCGPTLTHVGHVLLCMSM